MLIGAQNEILDKISGTGPLLINVPHAGVALPDPIRSQLRPEALDLCDTDWHIDRIAADLLPSTASLIVARQSRYVIDLNRPRDDTPLYTGATTGLISTIDFDGNPLYQPNAEPDADERARRIEAVWVPYHKSLAQEIARIKAAHGYCLLLDMHSIRSHVPRLFDGRLPDLNLGTNAGAACAPDLSDAAYAALAHGTLTRIRDGRFKGGFITRNYGAPQDGVHALQIEIAQSAYMIEETPWTYLPERADQLKQVLAALIQAMSDFVPAQVMKV